MATKRSASSKNAPRPTVPTTRAEAALFKRLHDALSDDELERTLARALVGLSPTALRLLVGRLGDDTGAALLVAMAPKANVDRPLRAHAKTLQEWRRAWATWDSVIEESSAEGGKYIAQDREWEAPYFTAAALERDLDAAAARMLPLVADVRAHQLDVGFDFAAKIRTSADDIGAGLPDWMDAAAGDRCELGPHATRALVEWEWRAKVADGASIAFATIDRLCELDAALDQLRLDVAVVSRFVTAMSEAERCEVVDGIAANRNAGHWARALSTSRGAWSQFYDTLTRRRPRRA